ncbi:MAG: hypothetical protein A3F68_10675 [Acidobacteria bacterium RIFCSPLOWO2_12_FULL_54_10]|nr:MAG: hypothetical protein A3F68_10675 [Acidobacteria bacterium RIFCSPLOWO2_12_FULL_54_10]
MATLPTKLYKPGSGGTITVSDPEAAQKYLADGWKYVQSEERIGNLQCPLCRKKHPWQTLLFVNELGWRCAECKRYGDWGKCPKCESPMWSSPIGHSPARHHCNRCHFKLEWRDVAWVEVDDPGWPKRLVHKDAYLFDPNDPSPKGETVNNEGEVQQARELGYFITAEARTIAQQNFAALVAGPNSNLFHYSNKGGLIDRVFKARYDAAVGPAQWQVIAEYKDNFQDFAWESQWAKEKVKNVPPPLYDRNAIARERGPDLDKHRERVDLEDKLRSELSAIAEILGTDALLETNNLRKRFPTYKLWEILSEAEQQELLTVEFKPRKYARSLTGRRFSVGEESIKKSRQKLRILPK